MALGHAFHGNRGPCPGACLSGLSRAGPTLLFALRPQAAACLAWPAADWSVAVPDGGTNRAWLGVDRAMCRKGDWRGRNGKSCRRGDTADRGVLGGGAHPGARLQSAGGRCFPACAFAQARAARPACAVALVAADAARDGRRRSAAAPAGAGW